MTSEEIELQPENFLPEEEKTLKKMKDDPVETGELAVFYEWFRENTKTKKGVVVDMADPKDQDIYEPAQAARYVLAFHLGSEWERTDPSPENRPDAVQEMMEKLREEE